MDLRHQSVTNPKPTIQAYPEISLHWHVPKTLFFLNEFHRTYCYTFWKTTREETFSCDVAIDDIEGPIGCFFETLGDATGSEQKLKKNEVYSLCQKFQSETFYIYETGESFLYVLHDERDHLNVSADKGCSICGIIADGFGQIEGNLC